MSSQNNFVTNMIDGSSSSVAHVPEETQMERDDHRRVRQENEELRREIELYKSVMNNVSCPDCDGHGIQAEIARRVQAGRVGNNHEASGSRNMGASSSRGIRSSSAEVVTTYGQGIIVPYSFGAMPPIDELSQQQLGQMNYKIEKSVVLNMAIAAMEELDELSQMGEPMWIPIHGDGHTHQLNEEEYFKAFPIGFGPRPANLHCEATRHTTTLSLNSASIIDIFLNLTHFKSVFNAIVARAATLEVLPTGSCNGILQVISTELQMLCHNVPFRQSMLARYFRKLGEGKWGIADVSIDVFRPNHQLKYRKRPSGCIIEDLPNGFSKVTWVEHVEAQEVGIHPMFRPLVVSGCAFGAKRWLGILERQTDRLVSVLSRALPYQDIMVINMESKRAMTRMAERIVASYNEGAGAGVGAPWIAVEHGHGEGTNDIKFFMLTNVDNPGRPIGVMLSSTVSFWLPALPMNVFEYIRNPETRHEWDIFTIGGRAVEFSKIVMGRDQANCISLIRHRNCVNKMWILQEANWDPMGAYLIYAPVDVDAVNMVMEGVVDPDHVAMLPSGFVVFPDGPNNGGGGSMVTLSYQILVDSSPHYHNLHESVLLATNLITTTIDDLTTHFNNQRNQHAIP